MTEIFYLCGLLFYAPRLILVRNPQDLIPFVVFLFQCLLCGNAFSQTVTRRLSLFASTATCCLCLFMLFRNIYFDMGLLFSFLYWFALCCYSLLQDEPCFPQQPMI